MLFDREAELASLRDALDSARAGRGRIVVVEGEPGIGKTALLEHARAAADESGFVILRAAGAELERDFAWGVTRQLFEPIVHRGVAAPSLLDGVASLSRPALGLSAPGELASGDDPAFAARHGLFWLAANLAESDPVAIVVDDAHWADSASLLFLHHLGHRIADLSLVIVIGTRAAEPGAPRDLLRSLRMLAASEVVEPAPLSPDAVAGAIGQQLDAEPGPLLRDACHRATGGNPFLLGVLIRALGDDALADDEDAAIQAAALGPRTIADSVLLRLAAMSPAAVALARSVAVLGADAEPWLAASMAGLEVDEGHAAADALIDAQVFASDTPLRFVHPIVRQAVYADLSPGRRSIEHRRAAEVLGESGASPERLAVHLLATDPSGDLSVADRLLAAAQVALARGAPREALALARRALAEPPATAQRATVLLSIGRAQRALGDLGAATAHRRAALDAASGPQRDEIARELATTLTSAASPHESLAVLERAVVECPPDERERRLRLEGDLAIHGVAHDELTRRSTDRAERIAAGLNGDTPAERVLLGAVAYWRALSVTATAAAAAELAERALADGQLLHETTTDGFTFIWAALVLLWADRDDAAERYWHAGIEDARGRGSGSALVNASIALARLHMYRGDVAEAEAAIRLVDEVAPHIGYPYGAYSAAAGLVLALVERGELEEAEAVLDQHGVAVGPLPLLATGQTLLHARIVLRNAQARHDEAAADARELLRRQAIRGHAGLPHGPAVVEALLHVGDDEAALQVATTQLETAQRWGATSSVAVARRSLGLASPDDAGLELLRASAAALEETPCRLELARALTYLGAALRRQNQRAEAREPLRRALDLAARCGSALVAAQARADLLACGARPRNEMRSGVDSLTPTERRVAELVADGLSNPEVAQRMFVTRGTIETHLRAVYRKLDIASRMALPAALGRNLTESQ